MSLINEFAIWDYRHDWTLDANTLYDAGAWPLSCTAKPIAAAASLCSLEPLARSPTMLPPAPSQQQQQSGCILSSDFTSWAGKHPLHWSRDDVLDWLFYVGIQGEHNVDFARYPTEALNTSSGADLARMTEGEFVQKMGPDYGSMLYGLFWQAMRKSGWTPEQRPQPQRLRPGTGIRCDGGGVVQPPLPTQPKTVNVPPTTAMPASAAVVPWSVGGVRYDESDAFALAFTPGCRTRSSCVYDDDDCDPFARRFAPSLPLPPTTSSAMRSSYVVAPPSPQPDDRLGDRQFSTESDDTAVLSRSDSGAEQASGDSPDEYDDDEESDETSGGSTVAGCRRAGDGDGTSTASRDGDAKCGSAKSKLLWEFVRDLLKDPLYNPRCIKWEDKAEGVFRFVQSDTVAKMWGRIKNNDNMTYEKLSRAMRYYYKRGILERVDGKRLVYKFSTGARGWS